MCILKRELCTKIDVGDAPSKGLECCYEGGLLYPRSVQSVILTHSLHNPEQPLQSVLTDLVLLTAMDSRLSSVKGMDAPTEGCFAEGQKHVLV